MPLGAYNLWPLIEYRSTPSAFTSTGILPAACTPSTWNRTPASRAMRGDLGDGLNRADFVVGVHHGDQRGIGPDGAAHVVRDRRCHSRPTGTYRDVELLAHAQHGRMLDGGGDDMRRASAQTPKIARLFASVPPLVKINLARLAAQQSATCRRAISSRCFAICPS